MRSTKAKAHRRFTLPARTVEALREHRTVDSLIG
jgi:hypothetical protein